MPIIRGATKSPWGVETSAGFRRIASIERIPTCGALMMGVVKLVPKAPLLLIEYVAPDEIARTKLAGPRLVDLPADRPGEANHSEITRVAHNRHDESIVIKIDRDFQIDVVRKREGIAVEARIDLREGGEREAGGARDERQMGKRKANVRLLEGLPTCSSHKVDRGEVDLDRLEHVRDRIARQLSARRPPSSGASCST